MWYISRSMPDEKNPPIGVSQPGLPVIPDPMPGVRGERDLHVSSELGKFIEVNKVPDLDGPEKLGTEQVVTDKIINEIPTKAPVGTGAPVKKEEKPEVPAKTSDTSNVIPFRVKAKGDPTDAKVVEAKILEREEDRTEQMKEEAA